MAATNIFSINLQFYFLPDALMKNELISITYNIYAGMKYEDRTKPQVVSQMGNVWEYLSTH